MDAFTLILVLLFTSIAGNIVQALFLYDLKLDSDSGWRSVKYYREKCEHGK